MLQVEAQDHERSRDDRVNTPYSSCMDWNVVASCAAVVAAFATVVTAGIIVWQTRYTLRIQTLTQMLTQWQSPPMLPRMRHRAARLLWQLAQEQTVAFASRPAAAVAIAKQTTLELEIAGDTSSVDEVLDFFDTIAFFIDKGVLDFEMAYQTFYWPMACYWLLTEHYIREAQQDEGDELWSKYSALMARFIARVREPASVTQAKEFLLDEQMRTSVRKAKS